MTTLEVRRDDFAEARVVHESPAVLADGQALLAVERFGITANVILPGTMDTPANRKAMPDTDPARWVAPSQVAALLVHLASDAASNVNGAVIPILGGEL